MSEDYYFTCIILNHDDNHYMHDESIGIIAYVINETQEQYQFLDRQFLSLPMH